MDRYIDITILPDSEFSASVLLNALYAKLHKVLYDLAATNIGISFPKYNLTLGNILRIHGEHFALSELQNINWLGGIKSYCSVSAITPVPVGSKFRTVSRKQAAMSQAKLRRLMRRGSMTEAEAEEYRAKMLSKSLDNPYVELVSGSNNQKHRRYIQFGELLDHPVLGQFDQFGLSKSATIPWFG